MQHTTQLRIVAALLLIVIALGVGLFFFLPEAKQTVSETPETPPPIAEYEKIRDAEISLDPALFFSQTIGGSGNEEIVDIHYDDGRIFIFGNTESSDCDFDKSGAFVAILASNGKTIRFVTFDGTLVDVTISGSGFVLAVSSLVPTLISINNDGDEVARCALSTEREEIPVDLLVTESGYLLVTRLSQSLSGFNRLKLNMIGFDLSYVGSIISDEVYSLEYIDTLDYMGKFILLANAKSSLRNMLCCGAWGEKLAHYPLDFSYVVSSFWILDDFYFLSQSENVTMLLRQNGDVIPLCDTSKKGTLVGDNRCMYASVGDEFFCIKDDRILFSDRYGQTAFYVDKYIYAASIKENSVFIRSFFEGNKTFEGSFACQMTDPHLLVCEDGMYVVGLTQGSLGGDDITLFKISY